MARTRTKQPTINRGKETTPFLLNHFLQILHNKKTKDKVGIYEWEYGDLVESL